MNDRYLAAAAGLLLGLLAGPVQASPQRPWQTDVEGALATAKAEDRLLLVDLSAEWCGWCRVLEREVFPDPAFVAATRDFVLLRVDVEDGDEGSRLAARHGVDSLPRLLVLEPSGARAGEVNGYAPVDQFLARLEAVLAVRERRLESYRRTLASGDAEALRRTAVDFYGRRDGERAAALLERLLEVARLEPAGETWARVLLADSWRLAGRADAARLAAERAREASKQSGPLDEVIEEKLDLLDFWIAETSGECGSAVGALAAFGRAHPHSLYLGEARDALAQLRSAAGERCS